MSWWSDGEKPDRFMLSLGDDEKEEYYIRDESVRDEDEEE